MEFDLIAVAEQLRKAEQHPRLVGQICACKDLGSIGLDFEAAFIALQGLGQVLAREAAATNETDRSAYALAGRSLFAEALVKYARAFNSHEGRRVFSHNAGTAEQKAAHARLMQLRNRGIAHYHPSGLDDASFLEDRIVVRFDDATGEAAFGYPFRRYNYREADLHDLAQVLALAGCECDLQRKRAEAELRATLASLRTDPVVREAIEASPFDAAAFHGSAPAAEFLKDGGQTHSFHSSLLAAAND